MMNAVSTPIRQKPSKWQDELFDEMTPIKANEKDENDDGFEFDNLFDNLASDSFLFGEGKRKSTLVNSCVETILRDGSPDLRHLKKQKRDERKTQNITQGSDMFEDDMFMDSAKKSVNDTSRICSKSGVTSKITNQSSLIKHDNETFDNNFFNLSMFEKLEKGMEVDPKTTLLNCKRSVDEDSNELNVSVKENAGVKGMEVDPKTTLLNCKRSVDEDSNELNVSVKENAVVSTILSAMDLELENNEKDNKMNAGIINAPKGFSQILMESVLNWENNPDILKNDNCIKLDDKIRRKLAENANNMKIVKEETTGWSQITGFSNVLEDSILENSQYQELGPFYGLPSKVQKLYEEHKGIQDLYYWQRECLSLKAVKERKNLVFSLPTSGGKTLVAEMLILREILCYKRNVLFILPFVSIVQEKVHDLSIFAVELGFLVEEYAAGKGVIPLRKRRKRKSVIIATIEKASAVIISLIETNQLQEFGLIVVDELHLVSEDSGRGATLESLLTHVLYLGEKIQIIGMTATIGNLPEIAEFLKAESYTGSFRPVELEEYVKCGKDIFTVNLNAEEILQPVRVVKSPTSGSDPDGISELVLEIVPKGSVLVFCPTKKNCENVALLITEAMPRELKSFKENEKSSFLNALRTETNGQLCPVMRKTIPYGIVYHHSGLTPGERKLLEEGFRTGTLSVICCTSTLAAGVNLPASRVLLRSPYVGRDFISLSKYKQMIGRAGRAGMGCKGESYLICQTPDCVKVGTLLTSKMDDAMSRMNEDSLKSLILSSVGLGIGTTRGEIRNLVNCTLLSVQGQKLNVDVKKMIDICISSLFKMGAIRVKEVERREEEGISRLDITIRKADNKHLRITNNSQLSVSRLGRAAMKGCIGLERAHELYGDLIKAQSALVLLTELHLLYLVTPYEMIDQIKPNFSVYFNIYMQLSAKELPAAKTIGITEFVISRLATGMKPKNISDSVLNRFYIALILNEMLKQQNIWNVAKLFQITAGMVQNLMTQTSTFANNVLRFSEELSELWSFRSLLNEFAPRLAHCCSTELLPLMELPAVKRGRAKQLYDAGFKTLNAVANADVNEMVRSVDHLPKRVAEQIIAAARLLLLEKAENLREEAEEVLLGLADKVVSK